MDRKKLNKNAKLLKLYLHDPQDVSFIKYDGSMDDALLNFNRLNHKSDGDDLSLLVFTTIKQDRSFDISKVVLNSYIFD